LSSEVGNAALKQAALSLFAKCNHGATATEKNYFWVLWSFLISRSLRILILCPCKRQLIFFWNIFLKGPLGLFFNGESFIFQCRKHSAVASANSTLYVVNHHATRGYIAYHVGSTIKELWQNEKDT